MRDGLARGEVDEVRSHLAVVQYLHRSLSGMASRHGQDSVGSAAVRLDEDDEVLPVLSHGVIDADSLEPENGHSGTQRDPRTKATMEE
jgi:hypothetical protein